LTVALAEEENNGERGNGKKPFSSTNVRHPQGVRDSLSNEMKDIDEEVARGIQKPVKRPGKKQFSSTYGKHPYRVRDSLSDEMENVDEEVARGVGQIPKTDKYGKYSLPDLRSRNEE